MYWCASLYRDEIFFKPQDHKMIPQSQDHVRIWLYLQEIIRTFQSNLPNFTTFRKRSFVNLCIRVSNQRVARWRQDVETSWLLGVQKQVFPFENSSRDSEYTSNTGMHCNDVANGLPQRRSSFHGLVVWNWHHWTFRSAQQATLRSHPIPFFGSSTYLLLHHTFWWSPLRGRRLTRPGYSSDVRIIGIKPSLLQQKSSA